MKLFTLAGLGLGTALGFNRYSDRYDNNGYSRQIRDMVSDIDRSQWVRAETGGYLSATCKCDIECTPDSVNEICGADIAIALDMSQCDKEKWKKMTTFVNKLVNQLETEQELGGDRANARVALTLFAADTSDVIRMDDWNVENAEMPKADVREYFAEFERNSQWTMYPGVGLDYEKIFDWAADQFGNPRNPGVNEDIEALSFETTKLFVIVSDGHIERRRNMDQMQTDLLMAKADLNGKVVTVSQSEADTQNCLNGGVANCPNRDFLNEIGDVFVDGGDVIDAAREVANLVNQKKCIKHGECKPCDCECSFPRGPAGPQGPDGCDGQQGPCGTKGAPGIDGAHGVTGPVGDPGVPGIKGDCGDPGPPGEKGPPGTPAPEGETADVGPIGVPGDRGNCGEPGDAGAKGVPGVKGPMGDPGPMGERGDPGRSGPCGEPGPLQLQNGRRSETMTPERYAEAIRLIVQEWMEKQENKEVLQCISECGTEKFEAVVTVEEPTECPDGHHPVSTPDGSGGCEKDPEPPSCKEPLDIIFLVDGSDSIRKENWPLVGNWTNRLLSMVKPTEREKDTMVIYQQYSSSSYFPEAIKYTITSETQPSAAQMTFEMLQHDIEDQEQRSQGTDTYHALNEINKMFDTELRSTSDGNGPDGRDDDVTTILITLTDGAARDRAKNRKDSVMNEIKKRVDIMASVGVGSLVLRNELEDISHDSDHILMYKDYKQLNELAHEIITLIGQDCDTKNERDEFKRRNVVPAESRGPLEYFNHDSSSAPDTDEDFLDFSRYWPNGREDRRHRH